MKDRSYFTERRKSALKEMARQALLSEQTGDARIISMTKLMIRDLLISLGYSNKLMAKP